MKNIGRTITLFIFSLSILSACGQGVVTQSVPTNMNGDGKIAMVNYSKFDVPFSFSYPRAWQVKQVDKNSVELTSPQTIAQQVQNEPESSFKGDGNPFAPDVIISYYANIADEPTNKSERWGAKTLPELLTKMKSTIQMIEDTTVAGVSAKSFTMSMLAPIYAVYIPSAKGLYTMKFFKKGKAAELSAEERSILLSTVLKE